MGWINHPFHPAIPLLNSFYYLIADGVVRSLFANGPRANLFLVDTTHGGDPGRAPATALSRAREQSVEDDASLDDLSPFEQRGGKLLLVHGVADSIIPTDGSVLLYQRIVKAMGQQRTDGFVQLYLIPGFGHGRGIFDAGFDTVGVLDRWADEGLRPEHLIAIDQNRGANRRERPMCEWQAGPDLQV